MLAGFSEDSLAAGKSQLSSVSQASIATASNAGGSLAEYFLTVRNDLRSLSGLQMKRLLLVVDDGTAKILFSRLEPGHDSSRAN